MIDVPRRRIRARTIVFGVTIDDSLQFIEGFPEKLVEKGWTVHVVGQHGPRMKKLGTVPGVRTHRLDIRRHPSVPHDLVTLTKLIRCLWTISPECVIFGTPKMSLLGISAAFISRVPRRMYLVHGLRLEGARGFGRRPLRFIESLICRLSTVAIAVSPSLMLAMLEARICRRDKVRVLGDGSANGIDVGYFVPGTAAECRDARAELDIKERERVVLIVGRLTKDKGLRELPYVIRKVHDVLPHTVFVIVGHNEAKSVGDKRAHGLLAGMDNVQMYSHTDSIRSFYHASDLLFLPTYREGLPTVVLEAAACGVPPSPPGRLEQ